MKKLFLLSFLVFQYCSVSAQVAINTTGNNPHASAGLDVDFGNKGLLIPRVNLTSATDVTTIPSPATSLLVYNTGSGGLSPAGYYYWNGSQWEMLGSIGGSGVATRVAFWSGTNTLSSNANLFWDNTNNRLGIGTTTPAYRLDLNQGTFAFGNGNVRTEIRDNAGLQGNAGAQSGFFETSAPTNYPSGATGWWHLIDSRHSNNSNNYAMQIAGSFFDQFLYYRKTNNNAAQPWKLVVATDNFGNAGQVLTSQGANQTPQWQDAPGRPVFIHPHQIFNGTGFHSTFQTISLSGIVPTTAKLVILEAEYGISGPDGGDVDAHVYVRANASSSTYVLTRGRSAANRDNFAMASKGMYQIDTGTHSFQYIVDNPGFNGGVIIRIIGYIP